MKRYAIEEYILGVTATSRNVHAVLVQDTESGPVIVRQFHRTVGESGSQQSFAPVTPDLNDSGSSDISFNVGGESDIGGSLFLAGEFGQADSQGSFDGDGNTGSAFQATAKFDLELLDIIAECQDAGFENFRIAFAIGTGFLRTSEIKVSASRKTADPASASSSSLLSIGKGKRGKKSIEGVFAEKHDGEFDPGKVVFLPMKSNDPNITKALAVFAANHEPVEPTLQTIRDRKRTIPGIDLLDTEITLFLGLARAAQKKSAELDHHEDTEEGPTLLVRAGTEDTIVMFIDGDELVRFESLRSITAFDPPETICSRVLLLQDEFGLGDAGTVVLLGEEREESLAESFRTFFPDTRVTLLRDFLPELRSDDGNIVRGDAVLAAAVTLRILSDAEAKSVFLKINFLPRKLLRTQFKMPFAWPLAAMYAILFVTSLFFMYRYYTQKHELELFKYELAQYPEELMTANATELQSKIDSLHSRTIGLVGALDILDSLLIGSDRWSRALSSTAAITAEVQGIWIESWREEKEGLMISGTATDRLSAVSFATQAEATIATLEFSDIRGFPVYTFTMHMQAPIELPNVARYFRDNVELDNPVSNSLD